MTTISEGLTLQSPTLSKYQSETSHLKSISELSHLAQRINEYSSKYTNQRPSKLSMLDLASERFAELEVINTTLDKFNSFASFMEQEKIDCMEQGLKMIKLIYSLGERKLSKENIKQKGSVQLLKVIAQKEMNTFQKLTDFIMENLIPSDISPNNLIHLIQVIFQIFFSIQVEKNEGLKQKQKVKKKEPKPMISNVYYCLQSGQKVNLPWIMIFRILQKKHLQETRFTFQEQIIEFVQSQVSKSINIILAFIIKINDGHSLLKNLVGCLVDNVKEIELPIVPFFLKIFVDTLINEFKTQYKFHGSLPSHLLLGKSIFSIENMSILCNLTKIFQASMNLFQMEMESLIEKTCSYCGFKRQEMTNYQTIKTNYSNSERLTFCVCINCCRELGFQPDNNLEIMAFTPLIMSRFWNWNQSKNLTQMKNCLKLLILYHQATTPAKKNSNKNKKKTTVEITDSVAMNNTDEVVGLKFLQGVYLNFLFNHSKISLKSIQYEILNLLLICMNAKEQKIRQKACKMCDQPHVIEFVFDQIQKTEEGNSFKQKFEMIALVKLRDGQLNIKVAALSLLSSIYSRESVQSNLKLEFYRTIYKDITFSNNPEYISKSINIIDKSIFKFIRSKGLQDLLGAVQIAVQTYYFCIDCMEKLKPETESYLRAQICKLINKILEEIYQICKAQEQEHDEEEQSLTHPFKQSIKIDEITKQNLKAVYETLIQKSLEWNHMDQDIIKSFPVLTPALVATLMQPRSLRQTQIEKLPIIQNLLKIINISFEDVTEVRKAVYKEIQKSSSKSKAMFDINQLRNYFFSQIFFEKLLSKKGFDQIRETILNRLILIFNFYSVILNRKKFTGPLKNFAKGKSKLMNLTRFMTEPIEKMLIQLNNCLLVDIKACHWTRIPLKAELINGILFLFQQKGQISSIIFNYKECAASFLAQIKNNVLSFEDSSNKEENFTNIVNQYILTLRLAQTFTTLVSSFEIINNFDSFLEKAQHQQSKQSKKSKKSLYQPSFQFQACYELIIEIISMDYPEIKRNPRLQNYYKEFILLLNSYWSIYPDTILSCGKMLKELISNIDQRGFIKDVYRLFLTLLPSTDMRILQLIDHNLGSSFHRIFEFRGLRQDHQMLQYCFRLLQHILRSGMSSLLDYNKYLFCGLLHQSPIVSTISLEVVREIYCNEASEKMLFVNMGDTLKFIYQFYFEGCQKVPELSEGQKKGLRFIAGITRSQSKCMLVREKRALKIKTSFVKKLSEILGAKGNLLQQNPLYLAFLVNLANCQDSLDYSQLYEILFTVNKIAGDNYTFVQGLRCQLEEQESQDSLSPHQISIISAYRQVVRCLTYLSAYQPVNKQLANYARLFDSCTVPYASLQEEQPLSTSEPNESLNDLLIRMGEDIDLHISISVGGVEIVSDRSRKPSEFQQETQDESCSSLTNQTKQKGRKSRGKQKSTKKGSRIFSARKERSGRKCGREQEEWSGNTSSINQSPY